MRCGQCGRRPCHGPQGGLCPCSQPCGGRRCASPLRHGTSIRCGCASASWRAICASSGPTFSACRRPSAATPNFPRRSFTSSAMSTSRSTARRAITASPLSRAIPFSRAGSANSAARAIPATCTRRWAARPRALKSIIFMCRPAATSRTRRSTTNSRTSSPSSTKWRAGRAPRESRGAGDPGRRPQYRAART